MNDIVPCERMIRQRPLLIYRKKKSFKLAIYIQSNYGGRFPSTNLNPTKTEKLFHARHKLNWLAVGTQQKVTRII